MGDVAKRHHFVPNVYLKGFAQVPDGEKYGQITVLTLKDQSAKTISTRHTALNNDFYSLAGNTSGRPDAFERIMSERIETPSAPILRHMREGGKWPLSSRDRSTLAEFMALQWLRGPDHRQAVQAGINSVENLLEYVKDADGLRRWSQQKGDALAVDESLRLWEELGSWKPLTISSADHVSLIGQGHSEATRSILDRPWKMVRFPDPTLFTSDAPLSLLPGGNVTRGAFSLRASPYFFPVGRDVGIILSAEVAPEHVHSARSGGRDGYRVGTRKQSGLLGSAVVSGAMERLFHHPDDAPSIPEPFEKVQKARRRVNVTPSLLRDALNETEQRRARNAKV